MATKVYGPDAFTVGADVNLEVYDAANWAANAVSVGGTQKVMAATDDVRVTPVSTASITRYIGITLVAQRIVGDIKLLSSVNAPFPGLRNRSATTEQDGYLAEWDNSAVQQKINLYRVTGGASPVFTLIASGGLVDGSAANNYLGGYLKATGTNPVALEAGDNTNGVAITTSDSNAARYQSGQPGLSIYNDGALACGIDNVEVWDESAAPVVLMQYNRNLALQQRMAS
jgi:hypothetical protein